MLAAFNVTVLEALGYNDSIFLDPRQPDFSAESSDEDKYTQDAIIAKIQTLANMRPYADIAEVEEEEEEYYEENGDVEEED